MDAATVCLIERNREGALKYAPPTSFDSGVSASDDMPAAATFPRALVGYK